jgi:dynein heavy chain
VATRGSILYFIVAELAQIDPMYQYSLFAFTRLFNEIITNSQKSDDIDQRLAVLIE